jgi:hypothetical protein
MGLPARTRSPQRKFEGSLVYSRLSPSVSRDCLAAARRSQCRWQGSRSPESISASFGRYRRCDAFLALVDDTKRHDRMDDVKDDISDIEHHAIDRILHTEILHIAHSHLSQRQIHNDRATASLTAAAHSSPCGAAPTCASTILGWLSPRCKDGRHGCVSQRAVPKASPPFFWQLVR